MQKIEKGNLLEIECPIRAYDEQHTEYWLDGPVLVLDTNQYDVTLLSGETVLYSSWQEIAAELELM